MFSSSEIQPVELSTTLVDPACKESETMWLYFLLTKVYGSATVTAKLPGPREYEIYDFRINAIVPTQGIIKEPTASRFLIENKISFGKPTMLSLTGPFAGAICATASCSTDSSWDLQYLKISDVVPLRMIRHSFLVRPHWKEKLKALYGFEILDDIGSGWFVDVLLELLASLEWPHDRAQIERNAIDSATY